jgi:hypothetical protein
MKRLFVLLHDLLTTAPVHVPVLVPKKYVSTEGISQEQIEEHEAKLKTLREAILAVYPIGSEWYDANQDDIVIIHKHFPSRGVITKSYNRDDYSRFSYSELLTLTLVVPREGGWFDKYRKLQEQYDIEYKELTKDIKIWK